MKLIVGQAPPPVPITDPPSVPCELTPELSEFLGVPHPPTCVRQYLDHGLLSSANEAVRPRLPGLHVSDLGYSKDGGLCQRQLWLRENGAKLPAPPRPTKDSYGQKYGWDLGHMTEDWLAQMLADTMPGWRLEGRNLPCHYTHKSGCVLTGELDILIQEGGGLLDARQGIVDCKNLDDEKLKRMNAPYASGVCQQQGYISGSAWDADFALLVYMSRGNKGNKAVWEPEEPKAFFVPRDDDATDRRATEILGVFQSPDAPKVLSPKLTRKANKGPDSVAVDSPWQCNYCPFLDHGCEGALPKACRGKGLWGHIGDAQKFKTKAGLEPVVDAFGHDRLAELLLEG